jgi:hypothetical protein
LSLFRLIRAGFGPRRRITWQGGRPMREISAAVLIDRALSMSSTSRARIGDRADALVEEIGDLSARLAPAGRLVEVVASTALVARRARDSGTH